MRNIARIMLGTALLLAAPPPAAGNPSDPEIDRLVRDLGAEDLDARARATDRLIALGGSAREKVLAALPKESEDPEVRLRVETVRRAVADDPTPRFPHEREVATIAITSAGPEGAQGFNGKIAQPVEWGLEWEDARSETFRLLDLVLTDLEDTDPELRREAVQAVGGFQGERPKAVLLEGIGRLLGHKRPEVRAAAVEAAARLADEDWQADAAGIAAAKAWAEKKPRRAGPARAGEGIAPPEKAPPPEKAGDEEIERLTKDLGSRDFEARERATDRLIEIGVREPGRVLAALPKESEDPEVRLRVEAVRRAVSLDPQRRFPRERAVGSIAISGTGPEGPNGFYGKIAIPLAWNVQEIIWQEPLAQTLLLVDLVLTDLEDADPELRGQAVQAVGGFEGGRPKEVLLEGLSRLLDAKRPEVRATAVEAAAALAREGWAADAAGIAAAKAWVERKRGRAAKR